MQQQHRGVDCGLFANAFATELAYGNETVGVSAMRDHFLLCLEHKKVELFHMSENQLQLACLLPEQWFCQCCKTTCID